MGKNSQKAKIHQRIKLLETGIDSITPEFPHFKHVHISQIFHQMISNNGNPRNMSVFIMINKRSEKQKTSTTGSNRG